MLGLNPGHEILVYIIYYISVHSHEDTGFWYIHEGLMNEPPGFWYIYERALSIPSFGIS